MAKNQKNKASREEKEELTQEMDLDKTLTEVSDHYTQSQSLMDARRTRKNGWNDVVKAYYNVLPKNWPYLAQVTDPLIRTTILEKTARLFNGKLRGRVVPREGGDVVKAKVMNAVLDFEWDAATEGGTMLEKWALMDTQTRLFGASFGLCYWRYDGERVDTPEFKVLDNRDVFVDWTATHVKDANWVQVREFITIEELDDINAKGPEPIFKNLEELKRAVKDSTGTSRSNRYTSVVKEVRQQDETLLDKAFPVIEIVTEYRRDRWITFAPYYNLIIRDIETPYKKTGLPIVQLRYYPTGDDVYGDSEVEPVLSQQRFVNSLWSGFADQTNLAMRPPIKISNNATVRMDTLQYGPNALWLTGDSVNNVVEHNPNTAFIQAFQAAIVAAKSAYNTAVGEQSMGISNLDPTSTQRTATEVKGSIKQQLARDEYNQMFLEEALKDQMLWWIAFNKQFLFSTKRDIKKVFRIVGNEMMRELKETGMHEMELNDDTSKSLADLVNQAGGEIDPEAISMMAGELKTPKYPVVMNPNEANPVNFDIRPKLEVDEKGKFASLYVTPDDLDGEYDFIPDVKSMSAGVFESEAKTRSDALQLLLDPNMQGVLQQQGLKVNLKEMLVRVLGDMGIDNAENLIEESKEEQYNPANAQQPGTGNIQAGESPDTAPQLGGMEIPNSIPGAEAAGSLPQSQEIPQ